MNNWSSSSHEVLPERVEREWWLIWIIPISPPPHQKTYLSGRVNRNKGGDFGENKVCCKLRLSSADLITVVECVRSEERILHVIYFVHILKVRIELLRSCQASSFCKESRTHTLTPHSKLLSLLLHPYSSINQAQPPIARNDGISSL